MNAYICKSCGASLPVIPGMTMCICEYCGTTQPVAAVRQGISETQIQDYYQQTLNCLARKEWRKAEEFAQRLSVNAPEDKRACILHMMCDYKLEKEEKLASLPFDMEQSPFYQTIIREGSEELKEKVKGYREASLPFYCETALQESADLAEIQKIQSLLEQYPQMRNAETLRQKCLEKCRDLEQIDREICYIKEQLEELNKRLAKFEAGIDLKNEWKKIAAHCEGKFKGSRYVPLIIGMSGSKGFLEDDAGAVFVLYAGETECVCITKNAPQFLFALCDRRVTKARVIQHSRADVNLNKPPIGEKDCSIRFGKEELTVLKIKAGIISFHLDVDYI